MIHHYVIFKKWVKIDEKKIAVSTNFGEFIDNYVMMTHYYLS